MYICELGGFLVNGNETLSLRISSTVDVETVFKKHRKGRIHLFRMGRGSFPFGSSTVFTTALFLFRWLAVVVLLFVYFSFLVVVRRSF